eukprot:gene6058-7019_t
MGETPILETPSNSGVESVQLTKSPLKGAPLKLVAGAGFEPTTFGVNVTFHLQESPQQRALLIIGTEKGTRTPTPYGHNHLKVACLPIPPPRQYSVYNLLTSALELEKPVLLLVLPTLLAGYEETGGKYSSKLTKKGRGTLASEHSI